MQNLKFAVLGTGFWSAYQLAGWQELGGVQPIAFYNRTIAKAQKLGDQYGVKDVYDDFDKLLDSHAGELDFVDIITDVDTHGLFTEKAANRGINVICQKPMAPTLDEAERMVASCEAADVKLFIHENFRWQAPIRKLKEILDSGVIGRPFKSNVCFCSGFPVFKNQPFLKDLEQFILTDIGSHVLDICRFLFEEVESLYCQTLRVNPTIKGEDVANVLMRMKSGLSCFAQMSYASILEREAFPQTLITVEGEEGSISLSHDYLLKITSRNGTITEIAKPREYAWLDPAYALVHSSIVDCNRNILNGLRGSGNTETTGRDNFKTVRLVHMAYKSAKENKVILL